MKKMTWKSWLGAVALLSFWGGRGYIACRDGGQWRLEHVLPGAGASSAAYRQAGSQEAELMALAQNMAGGEPFDAAQEKASKEKGWK